MAKEPSRQLLLPPELDEPKLKRLRAALVAGEGGALAGEFSMDELMAELDEEARCEALGHGQEPIRADRGDPIRLCPT